MARKIGDGFQKASKIEEEKTINFFENAVPMVTSESQKSPRSQEDKKTERFVTYLSEDDANKFNIIMAIQGVKQKKPLKPTEVVRQLILGYIEENKDLL